jgi:hypothetical protein
MILSAAPNVTTLPDVLKTMIAEVIAPFSCVSCVSWFLSFLRPP